MANVLTVPASGAIIFDNQLPGSSTISPLSSAPRIQYDNAGGINITSYTTDPSSLDRFTVDGTSGRLFSVTDALTGTIFSVNDVSGLPIIEVNSGATDVINIGTYGTNALVVNDSNVGIGTTTPSEKLTVVGNISASGTISADGVVINNTKAFSILDNAGIARTIATISQFNGVSIAPTAPVLTIGGSSGNMTLGFIAGNPGSKVSIGGNLSVGSSFGLLAAPSQGAIIQGNVGIGTSSPVAKLDILDTALAGSGSLSGSALNIAQTWNTTGTPTAIKLDVTDTASNASSLLMDLQVGGSSKFRVDKNGGIYFGYASIVPSLGWQGTLRIASGSLIIGNSGNGVQFSGGAILNDDFAGNNTFILAQRNGTNPQTFRLYNTYTDASNYERGFMRWNTNVLEIGTEAGGSGTTREVKIVGPSSAIRMISNLTITLHNDNQGVSRDDGFLVTSTRGYSFSLNSMSTGELSLRRLNDNGLVIGNRFATETRDLTLRSLSASGDIEATTIGNGVIIKSPNGTRYRITVDDDGALITTAI